MNRNTYICVQDRTVSRAVYAAHAVNSGSVTCPTCRVPMRNMGRNWRPPRKRDDAAWKRIAAGDIWTETPARLGDRPQAWVPRWFKGRRLKRDSWEPR